MYQGSNFSLPRGMIVFRPLMAFWRVPKPDHKKGKKPYFLLVLRKSSLASLVTSSVVGGLGGRSLSLQYIVFSFPLFHFITDQDFGNKQQKPSWLSQKMLFGLLPHSPASLPKFLKLHPAALLKKKSSTANVRQFG